jgi:cation transport regulator ChaC
MKIAVLGWGSLTWNPGDLKIADGWQTGGPQLPIEFSRISSDGRLTLVLDPQNGVDVTTQYSTSARENIDEAIEDLRCREGMPPSTENVGFVNLNTGKKRSHSDDVAAEIKEWARQNHFDAVIWTDLPSNFASKRKLERFTVEAAVAYLQGLCGETAQRAREYILKAPGEVNTPVRRKLQEIGWLNEERL